jgi:hypothetical protein
MALKDFTKAISDKANITVRAQASQMLQELLKGSSQLFDPKNPFSIQSGASLLSKGIVEVPDTSPRAKREFREVNLTETFRAEGEKQGKTALVLTDQNLLQILTSLNVGLASNTKEEAIQKYVNFLVSNYGNKYKAKHFEFYVDDGAGNSVLSSKASRYGQRKLKDIFSSEDDSSNFTLKSGQKVTDFRGLNFSHANALTHLATFIWWCRNKSATTIAGAPKDKISAIEKEITALFHRGHIVAQTTGRAELSAKYVTSIKDQSGKETNPILLLIELSKRLDLAGANLSGTKKELEANINKDFSNKKNIRMNIGFQLIRDTEGQGNMDVAGLTTSLALISTLQNLLDKLAIEQTRAEKKESIVSPVKAVAGTVDNFAKVLNDFLKKLEKEDNKIYNKFNNLISKTDPDFMINLKSSDNIIDYIADNVVSITKTGLPTKDVKVNLPYQKIATSKVAKPKFPKITHLANKVKQKVQAVKNKSVAKIRDTKVKQSLAATQPPLSNLQNIINSLLAQQIRQNMGDGNRRDVLNYRTGRFAQSATVERLTQGREGMISAYYTYMKYPYATFSEGGRQEFPRSRDPKLLISKSIREIMQQQMITRMRAVLI